MRCNDTQRRANDARTRAALGEHVTASYVSSPFILGQPACQPASQPARQPAHGRPGYIPADHEEIGRRGATQQQGWRAERYCSTAEQHRFYQDWGVVRQGGRGHGVVRRGWLGWRGWVVGELVRSEAGIDSASELLAGALQGEPATAF